MGELPMLNWPAVLVFPHPPVYVVCVRWRSKVLYAAIMRMWTAGSSFEVGVFVMGLQSQAEIDLREFETAVLLGHWSENATCLMVKWIYAEMRYHKSQFLSVFLLESF